MGDYRVARQSGRTQRHMEKLVMWKKIGILTLSATLLFASAAAWAGKQKTGTEEGILYTDALQDLPLWTRDEQAG